MQSRGIKFRLPVAGRAGRIDNQASRRHSCARAANSVCYQYRKRDFPVVRDEGVDAAHRIPGQDLLLPIEGNRLADDSGGELAYRHVDALRWNRESGFNFIHSGSIMNFDTPQQRNYFPRLMCIRYSNSPLEALL